MMNHSKGISIILHGGLTLNFFKWPLLRFCAETLQVYFMYKKYE